MDLKKLNQDKLGMYYAYPWSFIEPWMLVHIIFPTLLASRRLYENYHKMGIITQSETFFVI
jgi:hypothetical protein